MPVTSLILHGTVTALKVKETLQAVLLCPRSVLMQKYFASEPKMYFWGWHPFIFI